MVGRIAGACRQCLQEDEDGKQVVNIASAGVTASLREQMPDVMAAVSRNVQQQLKQHEDAGRLDLVERYRWLQRRLAKLP